VRKRRGVLQHVTNARVPVETIVPSSSADLGFRSAYSYPDYTSPTLAPVLELFSPVKCRGSRVGQLLNPKP